MTLSQVNGHAMVQQVYIGASQHTVGDLVALEEAISDAPMRANLRHADHGANTFSRSDRNAVELAEGAMAACLAASNRNHSSIDAVILASNGIDAAGGLDSAWLGSLSQRLGLSSAAHYQIGLAGCASFHWAARLAASLVGAGQCNNVLIVTFDKVEGALQRLYAEGSDFPYLTGDAAAACLVSNSPEFLDYRLQGKVINIWDGHHATSPSLDAEIHHIDQLFQQVCSSAGVDMDQVDLLITNNYSMDVSRLYCQIAGMNETKAFTQTIATHAHCFGSDNIINLHHSQQARPLLPGQRVMLFSVGPCQWGACILQKLNRIPEVAC